MYGADSLQFFFRWSPNSDQCELQMIMTLLQLFTGAFNFTANYYVVCNTFCSETMTEMKIWDIQVQVMAWFWIGNKLLSEPMTVQFNDQWVSARKM